MGCNIDVFMEVKRDGEWKDNNLFRVVSGCGEYKDTSRYFPLSVYDGRNYTLFGLLAGVCNRDNMKPIAQPRGIPNDCSETVRRFMNGSTPSWLLLSEILEAQLKYAAFNETDMSYYAQRSASSSLESFIIAIRQHLVRTGIVHYNEEMAEKANDIRVLFSFED